MRLVRTAPIDRAARIIDSRCQREGARFSISACLAQHQPASSEVDNFRPGASPKGPSALTLQLRGQYRRAYRARRNRPPGLGRRQFRSGRADHAGGANLDNTQPPDRGDLLVASRSLRALRGGTGPCVDAHWALGYGPQSHLHAKTRHTDAITICPCYVCSVALSPVPPNAGELRQAGETSG
jgi:hypothetical protein